MKYLIVLMLIVLIGCQNNDVLQSTARVGEKYDKSVIYPKRGQMLHFSRDNGIVTGKYLSTIVWPTNLDGDITATGNANVPFLLPKNMIDMLPFQTYINMTGVVSLETWECWKKSPLLLVSDVFGISDAILTDIESKYTFCGDYNGYNAIWQFTDKSGNCFVVRCWIQDRWVLLDGYAFGWFGGGEGGLACVLAKLIIDDNFVRQGLPPSTDKSIQKVVYNLAPMKLRNGGQWIYHCPDPNY